MVYTCLHTRFHYLLPTDFTVSATVGLAAGPAFIFLPACAPPILLPHCSHAGSVLPVHTCSTLVHMDLRSITAILGRTTTWIARTLPAFCHHLRAFTTCHRTFVPPLPTACRAPFAGSAPAVLHHFLYWFILISVRCLQCCATLLYHLRLFSCLYFLFVGWTSATPTFTVWIGRYALPSLYHHLH